ncbi:hypothetical protein TNCT_192211 [Trichonephila clavata]|uniref:Uncharacterized protein n=1 Tax=Trichonephila clavata TaxID=2740835 RepID=A0A8X6J697_TRICU|nr:hypothetical protein TNCT_192211 [Trichonephila clavata]
MVSTFCVVKWRKRFLEGRELLEDDARSGQAHRVVTSELIEEVNAFVLDNLRIPVTRSNGYWVLAWAHHNASTLELSKNLCAVGSPTTDHRTAQYSNGVVFESSVTIS